MIKLPELGFKIFVFYFYSTGKRILGEGDMESIISTKLKLKKFNPHYSLDYGITSPFLSEFYELYNKIPRITEITLDEAQLYGLEFFFQGAGLAKSKGSLYALSNQKEKSSETMAQYYNEVKPEWMMEYMRALNELESLYALNS